MTPLEHLRPSPGSAEVWRDTRHADPPKESKGRPWLGGRVHLTSYEESDCRGCRKPLEAAISLMDPRHPVLEHAAAVLALWPELLEECAVLIDEVRSWFPGPDQLVSMMGAGGTSGPGPRPGVVVVMADNPVGYAEGLARELAYQKLQRVPPLSPALPAEMVAEIRELYAYAHVLEIELAASKRYDVSAMLSDRVVRVEHGRWGALSWEGDDPVTRVVMSMLVDWSTDLLERAGHLHPVEA